jgi:hypothetical protein
MNDVHAFEDALKLFEDIVAIGQDYKNGNRPGLGSVWTLLSDLKSIAQDLPDFKDEAVKASVQDWEKLGSRAVAAIVALIKVVA